MIINITWYACVCLPQIIDHLYMLAMTEKLNLHILGGDFLDIIILFAIVINTQIMGSFYLCNNHFCRVGSH